MEFTPPTGRMAAEIGVGSTIAAVKGKIPKVNCRQETGFRALLGRLS